MVIMDDTSLFEITEARVAEDLKEMLVGAGGSAASLWIPFSREKSSQRARKAEKLELGAVVDGDSGTIKGSTKRALDSLSLGFWLLRQEKAPRKGLQVFLGREVHTLQLRRPLFGVFE